MKKLLVSVAVFAVFPFILTAQATTAVAASKSSGIIKTDSEVPPGAMDKVRGDSEKKLIQWGPFKLFDDLYYVGTEGVGAFVLDTSAGLILIDAGNGIEDCGWMISGIQKIGLDPKDIKIILVTHEHGDHYGCVEEWKDKVCPSAKVAMTQIGWDNLRNQPDRAGGPPPAPKPESIDMFLTDGQLVKLGNTTVEILFTPGHSAGCFSCIFPVTDQGKKHVVGLFGGAGAPHTLEDIALYHTSAEYLEQKCIEAKCDVGLRTHAKKYKGIFENIKNRQPGEPHPLVLGTERFVTESIEEYYQNASYKFNDVSLKKSKQ